MLPALRVTCFLVLACLLCALPASAQPSSGAAEALFRAGRAASQQGDVAIACEKFHESYRLDPATGTLLNIAICEDALGQLSAAWEHFQQVLHELPEGEERVAIVNEHLRDLDPRLPRLIVQLAAAAPADTRVLLGAVELRAASFNVPLPLDPGEYTLQVEAHGRQPRSFALRLQQADRVTVQVEPGELLTPAPTASPDPAPKAAPVVAQNPAAHPAPPAAKVPPPDRTLSYALFITGGASLLTGGVTGLLALNRAAVVHDECISATKVCSPKGDSAAKAFQPLFVVTLVAFGAAAVSTAVALALMLTEPAAQSSVSLTPVFAPGHASLLVSGRF
jgi:hypothetical protein